ncbi:MAG: zinc-dependent alcohol dehydrogenase family protein [Acidobacteriota bacterium]
MQAMVLEEIGGPLRRRERRPAALGPGAVRLTVRACGVCRTDLHLLDGDLPDIPLPRIPGHEIVGVVEAVGEGVATPRVGERVGVGWLGTTCGTCAYCASGRENLCPTASFTGYQLDGGFAEQVVVAARACFALPDPFDDLHAAPLLCAGLIGHRALTRAGEARRLGLFGFGAAAHLITQVAVQAGREVYAFTRPGDVDRQAFARSLGACWAGGSDETAPEPLDAALLFAPVGALVPVALRQVAPGGVVVCAGIHMSAVPAFPYELLWGERTVCSVANLTRQDGIDFLRRAAGADLRPSVRRYGLTAANEALADLRAGRFTGAAVLVP